MSGALDETTGTPLSRRGLRHWGLTEESDMWKLVDVHVYGSWGMYSFELLTDAAIEWWSANVGTSHTMCDDTRYAMDIASGMQADGLNVI